MEFTCYSMLIDFTIAAIFLFVAKLLREKIKILQSLFIPGTVAALETGGDQHPKSGIQVRRKNAQDQHRKNDGEAVLETPSPRWPLIPWPGT